uniref:Odorant receptor n=1 Tax=Aulacocentrum confusum TaxID=2767324 RepID=A0A7G8Z930_9HYME|nr:olfactory receptor 11 [Aulacocentrum confusum]
MDMFNMDEAHQDHEWAVGATRLGLKVCGIWPNLQLTHWRKNLKTFRVMIATMIVIFFTTIPSSIALIQVWGDLTLIIDNLIINLPFLTAIVKLVVLWYKEEELCRLFNEIHEDWIRPKSSAEREIMIKNAKIARFITIFAYILVIWVIALHHLPFWVAGLIPRTTTNLTDIPGRGLVMQTIYFHDITDSPNFELTALGQIMSSLVAGSSYTTVDCVFGMLILHVSGQLELLKLRIENMCNDYQDFITREPRIFTKFIRIVAKLHIKLIRFVETMESIFSLMLLEQFTAFAIIFATEGFHLISIFVGDVKGTFATMNFAVSYFFYALFLIFLYSAAGEFLIENSQAVYSAAYNSQWFNLEARDMSQMIMVIIRAQKPLVVTAGKFAPISLRTFSSLIKTSAGYISMLLAVKS